MSQEVEEMRHACPELLAPRYLWSRTEVLSKPSPVPTSPGVYAWYFKRIPPNVPTADCLTVGGYTLLYIGISPKAPPGNGRPPSRQNLRSRLRYHFGGNADGSTLRLTMGCLLASELGLELRRIGNGNSLTFCGGEGRLSEWLNENAFVTWKACSEPWLLEEKLIQQFTLPLNLEHNERHPFHPILTGIRKASKETARRQAIWTPAPATK